jgi:imidazolonepropionase-like amidohydrolase
MSCNASKIVTRSYSPGPPRSAAERNPCPGRLGVVEEGALADLLLVDGDPLQDLSLVATPDRSFSVIMKDGRICKDGLAS